MGMSLRDKRLSGVTREMMHNWIKEWRKTPEAQEALENYLRDRLDEIEPGLADLEVDVSQRDDYDTDTVPFLQLIKDDLTSYGY